jgi:hypothetical protein
MTKVISPGMAAPEGQALFIHWTERRKRKLGHPSISA